MIEQNTDQASKNASSTRNPRSELNKNKCILAKGPKPLLKFKFYLDVKNHAVTSKLEGKIKDLGGATEFFLVKEVTHVISDRETCFGVHSGVLNSSLTPQLRSVESLGTNESPVSGHGSTSGGSLRQKTRADAMLEKVRSQSTSKCTDPLQNAKRWGIPIWTVNRVFNWLEKVSASVTVAVAHKARKVKLISIKVPFLKYEPFTRNARPVYKSLHSWPVLDLESIPGKPAFSTTTHSAADAQRSTATGRKLGEQQDTDLDVTNDARMTRKQRTRLSVRNGNKEQEVEKATTLVGGFCEICHCEYREISEHVRSEQHLNFVKNDANFLELDTLISAGANVEAFLRLNGNTGKDLNNYPLFGRRSLRKLNGKNTPEKYNGSLDEYSPPVTRNKMPRTRTTSHQSPPSPTGSDSGHHLRSRGQLWLPPNLLGTTAEDDPYSNRAKDIGKADRKSGCRLSEDEAKNTKENDAKQQQLQGSETTGRPKRTCPKSKRISADDRLVADNKTYYKVEVMTTKLRSSGLGHREHELARRAQTPIPEDPEDDSDEQGLVVKFKRVRRSELSVLNDEAENFMFPRKDDESVSDIDTDEAPNTTRSTIKSESSDLKSSASEGDIKSVGRWKCDVPQDRLDESTNSSSVTCSEYDSFPRREMDSVGRRELANVPRRRRTRNDTRLDPVEGEESNDTASGTNCEVENVPGRWRKPMRRDTKCDPVDLEDSNDVESVNSCRRHTRNNTRCELVELEDSNDVDSVVETVDNGRRRRTRNDTKCEPVELEESDANSELENVPKRPAKRTAKPDAPEDSNDDDDDDDDEVYVGSVANCTTESASTTIRKRRHAKSETFELDANSELAMEVRRKKRKIDAELTVYDECSVDGSTGSGRKKRRSQAEAFIADNQRYYRFETPGSRLRYQGVFLSQAGISKADSKKPGNNMLGIVKADANTPGIIKADSNKAGVYTTKPNTIKAGSGKADTNKDGCIKADSNTPNTNKPVAIKPDANKPDTNKSVAIKTDTNKPDVNKPCTVKPDTIKTDTIKPDSNKPGTIKPNANKPDIVKPDSIKSGSIKPDTNKPVTIKPDTNKSSTIKPDSTKRDANKADANTTATVKSSSNQADTPSKKKNSEPSVEQDVVQGTRPRMPQDTLKFSFELLPKSEPWYCTFERQDKGEEYYTCVSDSGYSNRFHLPYQFPYLRPLDPKVCVAEYHRKKEFYIKTEAAKLNVTIDSPAPSESVTEQSNESDKPLSELQHVRRRRRRFRKLHSNHPRKSPRQHASTLAILSSLIQQRKKRERKSNGESETSRVSLISIPEDDSRHNTSKTSGLNDSHHAQNTLVADNSALNSAMEDILTAPMDDISDLEYHAEDGIVIGDKPDAIDLLKNYNRAAPSKTSALVDQTPLATRTVRLVRRKRKKNRTGWPKKKRLFVKRAELKPGDGNNSSALDLDASRLTEVSAEEETVDVELCDGDLEESTVELLCDSSVGQRRTDAVDNATRAEQSDESTMTDQVQLVTGVTGVTKSKTSELIGATNTVHTTSSVTGVNPEHAITDTAIIQGVSNSTERRNSVSRDASGSDRDKATSDIALTDNNNSVISDKLADGPVKTEEDDADDELVERVRGSSNNSTDGWLYVAGIKHEELIIKSDRESENEDECPVVDGGDDVKPDYRSEPDDSNEDIRSGRQKSVLVAEATGFHPQVTVLDIRKLDIIACKKRGRNSSSECSVVEEVIASQTDKVSACVHVALDRWENAEKVLHAKMSENETVPNEKLLQYQPFVRVQKIDNSTLALQSVNRRLRSSSSPERKTKVRRPRIMPPSPKSPRKLRAPRGKWYRER